MHFFALFAKKIFKPREHHRMLEKAAIDGFLIVKRQKGPGRGYGWGL